jgi:hypothetical protein
MELENAAEVYCRQLGEKLGLLDAFSQETDHVRHLLDAGEIDRLGVHLRKRQECIDKVNRLDKETEGLLRSCRLSMEKCSGKTKQQIERCREQIKRTLESIASSDKECRSIARGLREELKGDILKMQKGAMATRGYGGTRRHNPRFLNVRQ